VSETAYIKTSVLEYLTARPTDNLILAANIKITRDWWGEYSSSLVIYVSEIVEDEASRGEDYTRIISARKATKYEQRTYFEQLSN
jgi:hypothetical protein